MRWSACIFRSSDSSNPFQRQLDIALTTLGCQTQSTSKWSDFLTQIHEVPAQNNMVIVDPTARGFNDAEFRSQIVKNESMRSLKILLIRQHSEDDFHSLEDRLDVDGMVTIQYSTFEIGFVLNRLLFPQHQNRRLHARALTHLITEFKLPIESKIERTHSVDASVAGVFIQTAKLLPMKTILDVSLHLPGNLRPINCKGEVMHSRSQPVGIGIRFDGMMNHDRNKLGEYLQPKLLRSERRATDRSAGLI